MLQSLIAYYLHERFGLGLEALGRVFFVGADRSPPPRCSSPRARRRRFGLLNTMVVSHLVSNVILIAIAVAPQRPLAVALLFARQLLSQMDVPDPAGLRDGGGPGPRARGRRHHHHAVAHGGAGGHARR